MIEIKNGVIKNINALCPSGQRYLKTLEKKLKLSNDFGNFDLGFFYQNSENSSSTWDSIKSKLLPNKEEFKTLFPSIKSIETTERQTKTPSEIVALIKTDILENLIALEHTYAKDRQFRNSLLKGIAYFFKRGSSLLAYAVFLLALTTVTAAVVFYTGAFAPFFATVMKLISGNATLIAATISATIFLTSVSCFISKYTLRKRDGAQNDAGIAEENYKKITETLEAGKQAEIKQPSPTVHAAATSIPSAPPLRHINPEETATSGISNAFSKSY